LVSTVANIALMSSASAETAAASQVLTIEQAAEVLAEAAVENTALRKWTLPSAGMYAIHAPGNSGVQISINGKLVVDATGTRLAEVGQNITGILSLQAGDHAIEVTGVDADQALLGSITVNAVGAEPQSLTDQTTAIEASEASEILAARASLDPAGAPANAATATGDAKTPFAIGGGSSKTSAGQVLTQTAAATSAPRAQSTATQAAVAAAQSRGSTKQTITLSSSIGRLGAIGSVPSVPTSLGGRSGSPDPDAPPPPPPPPPPPMDSVVISPLTPPANVTLTNAIELTAAGNAQGQVPNTGATLFGAVMEGMMYDEVDVVVGPMNRSVTVDVGPETGQFAVRLFEEDFEQGNNVTVTLTGGSSASDEVVSEPVEYRLTGVAPRDGATQALSRLSFGPTPALYARVQGIGFEAYVEEQLNPASIDDRAFASTRPQDLLNRTTNNRGEMFRSLMAYEIAHAAFSERQLQEIMGHFWKNHFHAVTKDTNMNQQNIDDRQFFRDNAFGNFEDLLLYSARSPLMSQYLDNDQNRVGNINENYGREILELSTVGVDGGYTEDDVIAVSRIFTGWRYERTNPNAEGVAAEYEFEFFPDQHDTDDKFIEFLDLTIPGRSGQEGVREGEELIAILAQHPETRAFVCGKIVQLLVADTPPARFVNACAAAWEETGGEIVPMLRAILLDPAYAQTVEYQRTKGKTPFEYSVSAIRAFGARPTNDVERFYRDFRETFEDAGYAMLYFPTPTGLPEVASAWANSASMIEAFNEMSDIAERRENYGIDLLADITDAGLETAEEVAAYLLTIATADRFAEEEYEALLVALKRSDGIFEPRRTNETRALERAMGIIAVSPSFQLQ